MAPAADRGGGLFRAFSDDIAFRDAIDLDGVAVHGFVDPAG